MLAAFSWLDPLHGDGYQWWSGLGGGSPLFVGIGLWWRHHNCRKSGCWRIGHPHPEHDHQPVCRRHRDAQRPGSR